MEGAEEITVEDDGSRTGWIMRKTNTKAEEARAKHFFTVLFRQPIRKTPTRTKRVKFWCSLQKLVGKKWVAHEGIGDIYVCTKRSKRFLERLWNATALPSPLRQFEPGLADVKNGVITVDFIDVTSGLPILVERVVAVVVEPFGGSVSALHRIRFFERDQEVGRLYTQVLHGIEILTNRWKSSNRKVLVD